MSKWRAFSDYHFFFMYQSSKPYLKFLYYGLSGRLLEMLKYKAMTPLNSPSEVSYFMIEFLEVLSITLF